MKILAIESSCDETAAAVVEDGRKVLSSVIASQVSEHIIYGGVVPEIASRMHAQAISGVVSKAMSDAGVGFGDIDAIAVTYAPGLIGALLVGSGNYLPRIGQNYTMGVKTPWALNDPENWRRTQRFGGKCFMLMGIAVAAFGLAGPYLTDAVVAAAISVVCLGGCIAMYAYSYLLFVGKIR